MTDDKTDTQENSTQMADATAGQRSEKSAANPLTNHQIAKLKPQSEPILDVVVNVPHRRNAGGRGYFYSFLCLFILPSMIVAAYFAFYASDQYYAEARFAVRLTNMSSSSDDTKAALSSLLNGGTSSMGGQDAFIITNYIHSTAIVDELSKTINVAEIFRRPEADFWARLPLKASQEDIGKYWNAQVSTYIDGPSGIVTVGVRAFRKQDALELAQKIVQESEKLANDVSTRLRNDGLVRANNEVRRTEGMVVAALSELDAFRNEEGYIDPTSEAQSTSQILLKLLSDRIQLQNELFVNRQVMAENAPANQNLKNNLSAMDAQISKLRAQLTGQSQSSKTINASLGRFEQLTLKRMFAEKLYTLAQDNLEMSKRRMDNQGIYISVFVPPKLPESAIFPKRLELSLIFIFSFLAVWGILALATASVQDHQF